MACSGFREARTKLRAPDRDRSPAVPDRRIPIQPLRTQSSSPRAFLVRVPVPACAEDDRNVVRVRAAQVSFASGAGRPIERGTADRSAIGLRDAHRRMARELTSVNFSMGGAPTRRGHRQAASMISSRSSNRISSTTTIAVQPARSIYGLGGYRCEWLRRLPLLLGCPQPLRRRRSCRPSDPGCGRRVALVGTTAVTGGSRPQGSGPSPGS